MNWFSLDNSNLSGNYTIDVRYACHFGQLKEGSQFTVVMYWCMAIVTFVTACILGRLICVVVEKLGRTDYIIPSMLMCLLLSCAGSVLFFINSIYISSWCHKQEIVEVIPASRPTLSAFSCNYYVSSSLPQLFLCVAVLLNINKWL